MSSSSDCAASFLEQKFAIMPSELKRFLSGKAANTKTYKIIVCLQCFTIWDFVMCVLQPYSRWELWSIISQNIQYRRVLNYRKGFSAYVMYSFVLLMMWRVRGLIPAGSFSSAWIRGISSPVSRFLIITLARISWFRAKQTHTHTFGE